MNDSAYRIPKAELHLHIEGTIEPELAFVLAERNAIRWPYASPDKLRLRYEFSNLQSFLDVYYEVSSVLRTEQDFADITEAYLARARAQGVRHAEIFFDPQAHASRNVPIATVIEGLHSATKSSVETYGISASLIMCFMRDHSAESAMETLMSALPHQAKFIGVGLDSAELGNPPSKFEKVFEVARQNGLHLVAHAGEEAPPDYVWDALRALKVERVDHGIRALEDPELVAYLRENQIPLTVCPLSNVKLKCYSTAT
jgi:adenosine deaminase